MPPSEQLDKKLKDEDAADDKAASVRGPKAFVMAAQTNRSRISPNSMVVCFCQQDEPLNIAPKKPNWDLKRDVQKKLDILNLRTQRAIADLLRTCIANPQHESCHTSYNLLFPHTLTHQVSALPMNLELPPRMLQKGWQTLSTELTTTQRT